MIGLYVDRNSPIHRLPPGVKLLFLCVVGVLIFLIDSWVWLFIGLCAVALLYVVARIPFAAASAQIRPLLFLLAIIFLFQALFGHWTTGVTLVMRFLILIMLSSLVALTTRVSAMVGVIETAMRPLRRFGVNPVKVSLAISLAIRFLPVIAQNFNEVREAQNARGLGTSIVATAVPMIVRTLRMADEIAEALDARSYDSEPAVFEETGALNTGAAREGIPDKPIEAKS